MNIKIARTMLILCGIYIIGFYILKFAFPDKLLLAITDPNVLKFGEFIESNIIFTYIYYAISTALTFYLFMCASKGSFKMKWYALVCMVGAIVIYFLVSDYAPEFEIHIVTSLMLVLAWINNGKMKYMIPTFIIHGLLQQLLLSIRGFETILLTANVASLMVLTLECYVWLLLLGLVFYLMEKKNVKSMSTIHRQGNQGLQSGTCKSTKGNQKSQKEI